MRQKVVVAGVGMIPFVKPGQSETYVAMGAQRQVEGARVALQHNVGIGGACVVTMYRND